jgi:hypothetical protein
MSISINPVLTTNAAGSFGISSAGYIQGVAQDDPAVRFQLAGGILGPNETYPMWGGVLISESTAPVASSGVIPLPNLGGYITRATSYPTSLYAPSGTAGVATGFSVFNQAHNWINTPQSQVPTAQPGMGVNFFRFGSNIRIPLAASAELVDLDGNVISQQVSWDTTLQMLIPYTPGFAQTTITGAVWANTAGGQTTFTVGTDLTSDLAAGDLIEVSGVVNTGGTSTSAYNGQWEVVSVGSTTVVVTQAAASSPGTYSSGGVILAQGGALPVRLLEVALGNSMTVNWNGTTNNASWNRSGTTALVLL